jgi:hypothetical protein
MRHLRDLTPDEVLLLPARVICTTGLRLLIAATRLPHRLAVTRVRAGVAAVPLSTVAVSAEEEHLAAPAANDKP